VADVIDVSSAEVMLVRIVSLSDVAETGKRRTLIVRIRRGTIKSER
jgi:hypothetical protein